MEFREIGKTGIMVSKIAMGTWSMGGDAQWGARDDEAALKAIQTAIDGGINLFDTAPAYGFGNSERLLGQAIRSVPREKLIIQTKCGFWWKDDEGAVIIERDGKVCRRNLSKRAILSDFDDSLKNLGIDYLDIYITHHQAREPFLVPKEETMDALLELKKAGKIRAIGVSNCTMEEVKEYQKYGTIDVIQERFSMLDPKKGNLFWELCQKENITFQGFSSLEQGLLTGKIRMDYQLDEKNLRKNIPWYQPDKRQKVLNMLDSWQGICEKYDCNLANLVTAWTAAKQDSMIVIGGGRKESHIRDYIKGGNLKLADEDLLIMNRDISTLLQEEAV
ncbi:MAG: aldo/keto reductase [Lachnospiraceae bacterium]|nr:aldo/keto reductase [Lachnospiraceae bacterium]